MKERGAFQIAALNNSYGMSKSDNLKYTQQKRQFEMQAWEIFFGCST
jgi:hypothetical protein